jgi:predicted kinase
MTPAVPSAESASENGEARSPAIDTSGASAPATQVTPKVSKGTVILAIGLPGSGKSSWFKRHNLTPLSSDMLRALLFDDPTEQRFQDLIFSNLRSMLKARLIARRPLNYVDATNLTPRERESWIKLAHDYGYEAQAVYFDVPLEVCLERNHKRERVVADDVMRRMSAKLKAPTFDEGFSKITVVRVKRKE